MRKLRAVSCCHLRPQAVTPIVSGAVNLVSALFCAGDGHWQNPCNRNPAGARGVVANVSTPAAIKISALAKPPCFTAGATVRVDVDCEQVVMTMRLRQRVSNRTSHWGEGGCKNRSQNSAFHLSPVNRLKIASFPRQLE